MGNNEIKYVLAERGESLVLLDCNKYKWIVVLTRKIQNTIGNVAPYIGFVGQR